MTKILIRPFVPAMANYIERWLTKKANQGLLLVNMNGWFFTFEQHKIQETEYFFYTGLDASEGFSYEYYRAKEKYAKKRSKINNLNRSVFEVDILKKDLEFSRFKILRNKYYTKKYLETLVFSLAFGGLSIFVTFYQPLFLYALLFWFCISAYSAISILILSQEKNRNTGDGSVS